MKVHIIINGTTGICPQDFLPYRYGHSEGRIYIGEKCAVVDLPGNIDLSYEDFCHLNEANNFKDALRKVILLHAVKQNMALEIERIVICEGAYEADSDEERYSVEISENSEGAEEDGFPFVNAFMGERRLLLVKKWQSEEVINSILTMVKSQVEEDGRMLSLYAFLGSQGRMRECDKFFYLWMSFNAYYTEVCRRFEREYDRRNPDLPRPEISENMSKREMKEYRKYHFENIDFKMIDFFVHILRPDSQKATRTLLETKQQVFNRMEGVINIISKKNYGDIYRCIEMMRPAPEETEYAEALQMIYECADEFGQDAYVYILCEYAYYLRNGLFHGKHTSLLFEEFDDRKVKIYAFVNHFLWKFLNHNIPELFIQTTLSDEVYEEQLQILNNMSER